MENKYPLNIFWSDEDGCFVATVPEFPNLSAFGETPEDAAKEASQVLTMVMESLARDGIPAPRPQKHLPQEFSGQVRLRMPKSLHADLAAAAEKEGVSLNTHMISLLSKNNSAFLMKEEIMSELRRHFKHQDEHFDVLHRKIGGKQNEKSEINWEPSSWDKADKLIKTLMQTA